MPTDLSGGRIPPPDEQTPTADAAPIRSPIAGRYKVVELDRRRRDGARLSSRATRALKRDVAIKVLSPELAEHPRFAQQLLREARAVAQLHHPHIATVYDVVDEEGRLSLVMESVRGETLARRLERGPAQAGGIRYGREIASALAHAHARGDRAL